MDFKEESLEYHRGKNGRAGKIGVAVLTSVKSKADLSLAYTPGVAAPCLEIAKNKEKVYEYTSKGNSVVVVSNGTAVLGLGNIGAAASKPVMEGKALLFKHFADIDAVDIEIDSEDVDEIVRTIELISGTYGGINLEDFKAPECFEIEKRLKDKLSIPVFHDDQHGTAVVVGAGLLNALKIAGKKIGEVKVVLNGAGAAGIAIGKMLRGLGVMKKSLIMCDSKGVVYTGREADETKLEFAIDTNRRSLTDAMEGADVFVGVSTRDVLVPEMLLSMRENPIVFALANPDPEIDYDLVKKTRDDVIMATGRSDYPNQVNNSLGFPGIFRGALDVRASDINEEMKIAAVHALSGLVEEPTRERFIVDPFDKRIVKVVAEGVGDAAKKSGVCREVVDEC
ncbi:MAG TPA: malate dehydrogenase [Candidatus Pacearchaeota archaeon]|nr:malate dehydrogenase [Candidatus Pacearchaeota archaeon]